MPIRPENRKRYPENWKEIRADILRRASHRCEGCGIRNHALGWRETDGSWKPMPLLGTLEARPRPMRIVLTIAHLDHTPENCASENLRAWCQQCHNRYDAPMRAKNRAARKAASKA